MTLKYKLLHRVRLTVLTVAVLFAANIGAGRTLPEPVSISEAFINLPAKVTEILPKSSRLDMIEYLNHDSIYQARTVMDGVAYIVRPVTDKFMQVRITDASLLTLRLLPSKNGEIIAAVYTLDGDRQAPDSQIWFFDSRWKQLNNSSIMPKLSIADFIDYSGLTKQEIKEIEESVPFPTITYTFPRQGTGIEAELTVGQFMGEEDYALIKPRLHKRNLLWNGKKFKLLPLPPQGMKPSL